MGQMFDPTGAVTEDPDSFQSREAADGEAEGAPTGSARIREVTEWPNEDRANANL